MMTRTFILCISILGYVAACYADGARSVLHRNPFERPKLQQPAGRAASPEITGAAAPAWELRGTLVAGRDSLADVDGVIIRVGDDVDGYRLVSVREGIAVFFGNGGRLVLTVEDAEDAGEYE